MIIDNNIVNYPTQHFLVWIMAEPIKIRSENAHFLSRLNFLHVVNYIGIVLPQVIYVVYRFVLHVGAHCASHKSIHLRGPSCVVVLSWNNNEVGFRKGKKNFPDDGFHLLYPLTRLVSTVPPSATRDGTRVRDVERGKPFRYMKSTTKHNFRLVDLTARRYRGAGFFPSVFRDVPENELEIFQLAHPRSIRRNQFPIGSIAPLYTSKQINNPHKFCGILR